MYKKAKGNKNSTLNVALLKGDYAVQHGMYEWYLCYPHIHVNLKSTS